MSRLLKQLHKEIRLSQWCLIFNYFTILLSYPLARVYTQTKFYEFYSADDFPLSVFISIILLFLSIFMSNKLQLRLSVTKIYSLLSLIFSMGLGLSYFLSDQFAVLSFLALAIKEIYIVMLLHLGFAFLNQITPTHLFKLILGPVGAFGSLAGILGAQLAKEVSPSIAIFLTILLILVSGFLFILASYKSQEKMNLNLSQNNDLPPIQSLKTIKYFASLILGLIAVTQFVVFISDYHFNQIFTKMITDSTEQAYLLANVYQKITILTFGLQVLIIPPLFKHIKESTIFILLPIFHLVSLIILFSFGIFSPFESSMYFFIFIKAIDYSLFSLTKEVLYSQLSYIHKVGMKYLCDMFVYRLSKAMIALVFSFAVVGSLHNQQSFFMILMALLLILWASLAWKSQKK